MIPKSGYRFRLREAMALSCGPMLRRAKAGRITSCAIPGHIERDARSHAFRLLDRARERARDASVRDRPHVDPQAGRFHHAVGRPRRRQDRVRALIRHLAGDETLDVPSPTFTLVQTYALPRITVVHADLFRVGRTSELTELGIDEAAADAVVLLEWPDRAAEALPPDRLDIAFTLAPHLGPNQRGGGTDRAWHVRAAARAARGDPAFPRRGGPRRCSAQPRAGATPRAAPTSASRARTAG